MNYECILKTKSIEFFQSEKCNMLLKYKKIFTIKLFKVKINKIIFINKILIVHLFSKISIWTIELQLL